MGIKPSSGLAYIYSQIFVLDRYDGKQARGVKPVFVVTKSRSMQREFPGNG